MGSVSISDFDFVESYTFPCPEEVKHQPSVVDAALPPIYSRRVLIFSTPPNPDRSAVIVALRTALQATVLDFPTLSYSVSFSTGQWRFLPGQANLRVKNLPELSFAQLQDTHFAPRLLKPKDLTSVPGMIDHVKAWDCCEFQITFIQDGLMLSVSINHLAMDGYSITKVLQRMAAHCGESGPALDRVPPQSFDRTRLSCTNCTAPSIEKMPAYTIVKGAFDFGSRMTGAISTRMYRFSPAAVAQLKKDASSPRKSEGESSPAWITTQDAVSALVFRQSFKARLATGIVGPDETVQYSFPVEYRAIIKEPPLPSDYIGNALLFTATRFMHIKELVQDGGLQTATAAVRRAIQDVDAEYVDNSIAVIKSLEDTRHFNFWGALNGKARAITSTTYKGFVMPSDWGQHLGKYEGMGLMDGGFGDGMFVVMPLTESGWDVIVTLASESMEVFEDEEWRKYAVRVDV
ncbi:unnamed protein product [Discula destructiva]